MQRIAETLARAAARPIRFSAIPLSCVALLLSTTGCADRVETRPIPEPIYATKRWTPPPQPPAPPSSVKPAPDRELAIKPNIEPATPGLPSGIIPPGGIKQGNWKVIVVHHSASNVDTPQGMDAYHRFTRHWENGLGYHFVIGGGVNYPDGKIFVGPRWTKQIQGAHCGVPAGTYFGVRRPDNFFNEHGIGICLIGDMNGRQPTPRQLAALENLTTYLCGKTGVQPSYIYGHGQVKQTECPGRNMRNRIVALRRHVSSALAHGEALVAPEVFALLPEDAQPPLSYDDLFEPMLALDDALAVESDHQCACPDEHDGFADLPLAAEWNFWWEKLGVGEWPLVSGFVTQSRDAFDASLLDHDFDANWMATALDAE